MLENLARIDTQSRAEAETARLERICRINAKQKALEQEIIKGTTNSRTFEELEETALQSLTARRSLPGERKLIILNRFVVNPPPKKYRL